MILLKSFLFKNKIKKFEEIKSNSFQLNTKNLMMNDFNPYDDGTESATIIELGQPAYQALYCWLTNLRPHFDISLIMTMDCYKIVMWITMYSM